MSIKHFTQGPLHLLWHPRPSFDKTNAGVTRGKDSWHFVGRLERRVPAVLQE